MIQSPPKLRKTGESMSLQKEQANIAHIFSISTCRLKSVASQEVYAFTTVLLISRLTCNVAWLFYDLNMLRDMEPRPVVATLNVVACWDH